MLICSDTKNNGIVKLMNRKDLDEFALRYHQYRCDRCGDVTQPGELVRPRCLNMIYCYSEVVDAIRQTVIDLIEKNGAGTLAKVPKPSLCNGKMKIITPNPAYLYLCKQCCIFTDDLVPCTNYRYFPHPTKFLTKLDDRHYPDYTADKIKALRRFETGDYRSDYRRICGSIQYAYAAGPCNVDLKDVPESLVHSSSPDTYLKH